MKIPRSLQRFACVAGVLPLLALLGADDGKSQFTVVPGISTLSGKPHNLTFPDVGLMHEVKVKPGDVVTVGEELASEDSELETMELRVLELKAKSTAQIDAAVKDAASKKTILENTQKSYDTGAATFIELEEAKLGSERSEIAVVFAREQHEQDQAEQAKEQKKIDKMKLISPVSGIVQKISIQPGEVVDPNKPDGVLTIVSNTPLCVDMHLQSALAEKLKVGDKVQVAYANDPEKWFDGAIIFFDPMVDAASDTQTVRIELPNKEGKAPGLQVSVRLPVASDKAGQTALNR